MSTLKNELCADLERRVSDRILEPTNAELLKKLIVNAESDNEAMMIAELGTTYKHTGLHFDIRLEKMTNEISYFSKNNKLSFHTDDDKPTNKLIIGDNYEALQNLLIQYKNHVDVIYIDPPYGKDSMGEFAKTNYENAITRDNLLSMLYPRLMLARHLLSDSGVIFCSIDDKNQAYVKCLFDEVFGEKNFIGTMIWRKKAGGGQTDEFFVTEHEYIMSYRRTENFEWFDTKNDISEDSFKYNDNKGKYAISKLEKWGSSAHREDRPTMYYSIIDPDGNEIFPIAPDGADGRWRVGHDRMFRLIENEGIHWEYNIVAHRWIPYEKCYYSESSGKLNKSRSILYNVAETGTATKLLTSIFSKKDLFESPKPIELLKTIIEHVDSEVVLDFFAGSGTTGHAVLDLNAKDGGNRTFILCQLNEKTDTTPNGIAYDVTAKRLKRIMTGECYDGDKDFEWVKKNKPYGGNLDVYEIASVANFEATEGKTPFDVIDETLYGKEKFQSMHEKIDWVCQNFSQTQKRL
ncbi:MAG: site-specific DNA-methyltransferase [Paludibacteraceae bacterium]|nr:site-specific DNA-methyltransferase [Paludibacteraceae bacterium]